MPAKKLSVDGHRRLIETLTADPRLKGARIVLLGGPEDTARKRRHRGGPRRRPVADRGRTARRVRERRGLRPRVLGDSLGMHMAIGLGKWVVAWFGPSCAAEIDLYDRGQKIMARVGCAPCWKRSCQQPVMCYDRVDYSEVANALARGLIWLTSSSKPPSPETFFSPSP